MAFKEMRAASSAGGGTALTSTAGFIQVPDRTAHIYLEPRNFAGAAVVKVALNPYLVVLKTTDNLATAGKLTDYSVEAQDASTATSVDVSALAAYSGGGSLYVGSHVPFRGVTIDVDGTNSAGTATLVAAYSSPGNVFKSLTITDGTESTRTFAQDGTITWTVPTDWVPDALARLETTHGSFSHQYKDLKLFWVRFSPSAAITDTSVTLDHVLAMNQATTYAELTSITTFDEDVHKGFGGIGCIEALTDAGTANLIVNVRPDGAF